MDDYIKRSDVIAELNAEGYTKNTRLHKRILAIPAADVRSVKEGIWTIGFGYPNPIGTFCSKCGFAWSEQIAAVILEPALSRIETNFCPNCGADMGGTP